MENLVKTLSELLRARGFKLTTAESCTGGLISSAITAQSGSSDIFDRGFVTYSNQSKMDMLGVNEDTLEKYGAVSTETAAEMTIGALANSAADYAISVTGIAGPTGGTETKPVGLVYIGICKRSEHPIVLENIFTGDRNAIRNQAATTGLTTLIKLLQQ
jgi:PncC family amidohydrolase